ncbi:MAG TPA: DnaA N-terminal domain-containing protein, partial [Solirubrobacteraceae bacterium]|nr:DnaA N-terminal domain-containing protein [Solirubrobacteraceae bacterium]
MDELRSRLREPDAADRLVWEQIRGELRRIAGDSAFEIWLKTLELRATDKAGVLVVVGAVATRSWLASRFGPLLTQAAGAVGRHMRLVDDRERQLLDAITPRTLADTG